MNPFELTRRAPPENQVLARHPEDSSLKAKRVSTSAVQLVRCS